MTCQTTGTWLYVPCAGELTRLSTFPAAWLHFGHYEVPIRCRVR